MLKAVIFDFGNVLAKVDRGETCRSLSRHSRLSPAEIRDRIFGTDIEWDAETGKIDSHGHFRRIKERIGGEDSWTYEEFVEEYSAGFDIIDEGVEALRLAASSRRALILSNTSYLHSLWLYSQEELATLPESFIFSFKVGIMKPDPGIWRAALKMASLEADECVYIDDVPEFCKAAEGLGFASINYRIGETDLVSEIKNRL